MHAQHACAFNAHLGQNVNVCKGIHNLISTYRFETIFSRRFGVSFTSSECLPDFHSPIYMHMPLNGRLISVRTLHIGSWPKMLSYVLNELFHMYCEMGVGNDNGLCMVAQEMLSITSLCCTECRGKPMPSSQTSGTASTMVDVNDKLLLE